MKIHMSRFPQETVWSSNLIFASRAWPHCLSSCMFPPWCGCVDDCLLPVEASSQWGLSADVPLNELCHHWVSWNLSFFTCELWVYALCFFKDLKNMYIVLSTCYIWQTLLGFSLFPNESWGYLSDSCAQGQGISYDWSWQFHFSSPWLVWGQEIQF